MIAAVRKTSRIPFTSLIITLIHLHRYREELLKRRSCCSTISIQGLSINLSCHWITLLTHHPGKAGTFLPLHPLTMLLELGLFLLINLPTLLIQLFGVSSVFTG